MVVVMMMVVVMFPVQASAANPTCVALGSKRERLNQEIATKQISLGEIRLKNKFSVPQTGVVTQQKIAAARTKTDVKRADIYKKLDAKAKTPAQKTALKTYQTDIATAISARRSAHDSARTLFITSANNLFATHRASVDAGLTVLKSQYDKSFTSAAMLCEKVGLEKATAQLKNDIATAEKNFVNSGNVAPIGLAAAIKNFADARQASVTSADKTFQESAATARLKLEKALGKNTKNILRPDNG